MFYSIKLDLKWLRLVLYAENWQSVVKMVTEIETES